MYNQTTQNWEPIYQHHRKTQLVDSKNIFLFVFATGSEPESIARREW